MSDACRGGKGLRVDLSLSERGVVLRDSVLSSHGLAVAATIRIHFREVLA